MKSWGWLIGLAVLIVVAVCIWNRNESVPEPTVDPRVAEEQARLQRVQEQEAIGRDLVQRGLAEAAYEHYLAQADLLGDRAVGQGILSVLSVAKTNDVLVTRVVEEAYKQGERLPITRNRIASWTLTQAVDAEDGEGFIKVTRTAIERGTPADSLYASFSKGFYAFIEKTGDDLRTEMLGLLDTLRKTPDLAESMQGAYAAAALDGAFIMNDFKTVKAIVDAGVPGYDEAWHTELKGKAMAHLALQEGRHEEAVALFQQHIERIAAWKEPVVNPMTGRPVPTEAVLGFNEKRIGDIWGGVPGREAEAAAAYARARQHYQQALATLDPTSPEYADAARELEAVPAVAEIPAAVPAAAAVPAVE